MPLVHHEKEIYDFNMSFVQEIFYSIRSHHNYVDNDDDTFCIMFVVYKHLLFLSWFVDFTGVSERDCCNI